MKRKKKKNVVPVVSQEKKYIEDFVSMSPEPQKRIIYGIHYSISCGGENHQYGQELLEILMSDIRSKRIIQFMGNNYLDIPEEDKRQLRERLAEFV